MNPPFGTVARACGITAVLLLASLLNACSSARMSDTESDRLFSEGRYDEAAQHLKEGMEKHGENGRDRLLYLFDLGLSLHNAGKYDESIKIFLQAEDLSDIKDYTSLATEASTLLISDNAKDYKGEDFEKVMVNVYLALDYALIGNFGEAQVEARKVNTKLYRMVNEGKRKYKQNAFARYLSAILYEAQGDWGDAYIDYKKTRELEPKFPGLGRDLWRMAELESNRDDMEKWDSEYHLDSADRVLARQRGSKSKKSEIIVVYQNGISPIKRPNHLLYSVPEFFPRTNPVTGANIAIDGISVGETAVLHSIEATAIQNLNEKYAGIIAKKVAGAAVKLVAADQIAKQTGSEALGALSQLLLFATDQADLRSWNLLPKDLQIARFIVEPGIHTIRVTPGSAGKAIERTIQVEPGKKVFVNTRYMPGM